MKTEIVRAVQKAGFSVYMRDRHDSWLIFTDGTRICYLQDDRLAGLSLSAVHIPNQTTGAGFKLADGLSLKDITTGALSCAFYAPDWASSMDIAASIKWRDMQAFLQACAFTAGYSLLETEG
jgi:hypothetical protein